MRLLVSGITPVTGGGAITLDAGNGAKPVFQNDGTSNPTTTQWASGEDVWLTYNSTLGSSGGWRILSAGGGAGGTKTSPNEVWYPSGITLNSNGSNTCYAGANGWYSTTGYQFSESNRCLIRMGAGNYATLTVPIPQNWTGAVSVGALVSLDGDNGSGAGLFVTDYSVSCNAGGGFNFFAGTAMSYNTATQTSHTLAGGAYAVGILDVVSPVVTGCAASTPSAKNFMTIQIARDASTTATDGTLFLGATVSLPYTM
jgi:hypothetical protein